MIKSLNVRVVLVFIGAVLISLIVGFSVSGRFYIPKVISLVEQDTTANGERLLQLLEQSPQDDLRMYMEQASALTNYRIEVYDAAKRLVFDNREGSDSILKGNSSDPIQIVLDGEVFSGLSDAGEKQRGPTILLVGLPFDFHGGHYAMFLKPRIGTILEVIRGVILTILVIVLLVGSLLILIAARYVVRPVRVLTQATRKLAAGDFDIDVQSNRQDEIGLLSNSFHHMAMELKTLDRMRTDFVNNVSHEIQSPLTSISGFTKALRRMQVDEAQRERYLAIIEEESERLSRIGQNLLRLSLLQAGRQRVEPRKFALDEQLRHIVIALEPQWRGKRIDVELALEEATVEADEDLLRQVWTNLLQNAIKFSPEGGFVRLTLAADADRAVVAVADNGIGFEEEEQARIFAPFYKVDRSRDAAVAGSGLGLSIAQRIVELHRGTIVARGEPGKGAKLNVSLPLRYRA
ncbi:sensor histidine kinase [Paenibacillus cymbidii]|uniref:sensor histidine kinase n=1 Tax=Paenibacillus cymbidii TaxID=1639034 RepID=UPI00108056DF|nr:HAMP domain-containing sensor histidine kinase [Paenibacillus cymbidii]